MPLTLEKVRSLSEFTLVCGCQNLIVFSQFREESDDIGPAGMRPKLIFLLSPRVYFICHLRRYITLRPALWIQNQIIRKVGTICISQRIPNFNLKSISPSSLSLFLFFSLLQCDSESDQEDKVRPISHIHLLLIKTVHYVIYSPLPLKQVCFQVFVKKESNIRLSLRARC